MEKNESQARTPTYYAHREPRFVVADAVYGIILGAGDVIQPGDVYESTSGRWEKAPCPGCAIQEGCQVRWVRPVEEPKN